MSGAALLAAALLAAAALTASRPARAQASPGVAAEALFVAGRELLEAGQTAEACRKFEASQRLDPALGTMLHLADCLERMGRTASAWSIFREAASLAQATGQADRQAIAETRWRALEPRLARVELQIPDAHRIPGLTIELAGVAVPPASWEVDLPVDPGEVNVRASAPGRSTWTTSLAIDATPSTTSVLIPVLAHAEPAKASPPPLAPAPRRAEVAPSEGAGSAGSAWRPVGIVIGGVGVAGLALGAIFGVQAVEKNDASLERCRPDDASLCTPAGVALREEAQSHAAISTSMVLGGAALLGAGVALFLAAPDGGDGRRVGRLAPHVGPDGAGLLLGGTL